MSPIAIKFLFCAALACVTILVWAALYTFLLHMASTARQKAMMSGEIFLASYRKTTPEKAALVRFLIRHAYNPLLMPTLATAIPFCIIASLANLFQQRKVVDSFFHGMGAEQKSAAIFFFYYTGKNFLILSPISTTLVLLLSLPLALIHFFEIRRSSVTGVEKIDMSVQYLWADVRREEHRVLLSA